MMKLYWAEWWVLISQYHTRNNRGAKVHKLKWFPRTKREYTRWIEKNDDIVPLSNCADYNANRATISTHARLAEMMVKDPFADKFNSQQVIGRWTRFDTRTFYHEFMWALEHIDSFVSESDKPRRDILKRERFWSTVDSILVELTESESIVDANGRRREGTYPIIWKTTQAERFVDWTVCCPLLYFEEKSTIPAQPNSGGSNLARSIRVDTLKGSQRDLMFLDIKFESGPMINWIMLGRILVFRMDRSEREQFRKNTPSAVRDDMGCFTNGGVSWNTMFNDGPKQIRETLNSLSQAYRKKFKKHKDLERAIYYNRDHYSEDNAMSRYHLFRYKDEDVEHMKELLDDRDYFNACKLAQVGVITEDFFRFLVRLRVYYNTQKIAYYGQNNVSDDEDGFDCLFKLSIEHGQIDL